MTLTWSFPSATAAPSNATHFSISPPVTSSVASTASRTRAARTRGRRGWPTNATSRAFATVQSTVPICASARGSRRRRPRLSPRDAGATPSKGELVRFAGSLGQRLLERALPAGLAGDRQLGGPCGDAADERCRAFAARDLDRCALAELGEQPCPVVLRGLIAPDLGLIELEEVHADVRALPRKPRDRDGAAAGNPDDRRLRHRPGQIADPATGPQHPAEGARAFGIDPDASAPPELLDRTVERRRIAGPTLDRDLAHPGKDSAEQLVL